MKNPALLKPLQLYQGKAVANQVYQPSKRISLQEATRWYISQGLRTHPQGEAGFTLIELIVVIIMISVLSAIAAPSWLAFVNRQRTSTLNDAVLSALQEAQSQAKNKKLSYSVSLITDDGVPKIAVHQGATAPTNTDVAPWKNVAQDLDIRPEQIWIGTNANGNEASDDLTAVSTSAIKTITFDYTGSLPPTPAPNLNNGQGLIIAVGIKQGSAQTPATGRCVKVSTLLGSIQSGFINPAADPPAVCEPR